FQNDGTFTKSAGTGATEVDVPFNNAGSTSVTSGTLSLAAGAANAGNVAVAAGTTLAAAGYTQTSGSTSLTGGTLARGPFNINAGSPLGSGTINGNLTNGGQVIPGGVGALGSLTVNGTYTQSASGSLNVEIGSGGSDLLAVSGPASLGGSVNIADLTSTA